MDNWLAEYLGHGDKIHISFESPTPSGYRYIGRNHRFVEQLCHRVIANSLAGPLLRAFLFELKGCFPKISKQRNAVQNRSKVCVQLAKSSIGALFEAIVGQTAHGYWCLFF